MKQIPRLLQADTLRKATEQALTGDAEPLRKLVGDTPALQPLVKLAQDIKETSERVKALGAEVEAHTEIAAAERRYQTYTRQPLRVH